ncbi:MAG: TRAP transporter substrate-binding protein DctP [Peptococcaceae bacterium]|jgi:TRAP-type C4-dicarboxylate transport system substrate-binding protein|nr:TRAP transporter substrate-binding protein DctP [Peptococcaceae bacterium]
MFKKLICIVVVSLLCVLSITGCGSTGSTGGSGGGGSSNFKKPDKPLDLDFSSIDWSSQPEIRIIWAIAQSANSAGGQNITIAMQDIGEKTGGKVRFELSGDAVLVDEAGMLEALESGLCQIVKQTPSVNVGLIPELECLVYPGFYNGNLERFAEFNRAIQPPIADIYKDHGFKQFSPNPTGTSGLLIKKMQITKPEDLKGMLLRASGASLAKVIETYGASSTVLGLGDVPTALDRGTIDGLFSSTSMMIDMHFTEVAKNLTVLAFREMLGDYSMSQKWYDSLTPEMQAVIDYYGDKYFDVVISRVDVTERENIEKAKSEGVNVLELTAEQSQPFADALKPLFEDFGKRTSDKGRALLKVIYDYNNWNWAF